MFAYLSTPFLVSPSPLRRRVSSSSESKIHGGLVFTNRAKSKRKRVIRFRQGCTRIRCDVSGVGAMSPGPGSENFRDEASTEAFRIRPFWRFLAETAIHLTIAGLAIAASVIAKARFFAFASAFLSVPQVVFSVRRYLREREGWSMFGTDAESRSEREVELDRSDDAEEKERAREVSKNLVTGASIRGVVVAEVDTLRRSIEQMETATLQRELARNRSIAEALASLDESIRAVRRTVETRNQIESSAPFALVAELEKTQSRLKNTEREKVELEVKVQLAQSNLEETKRQGERARREADDALQRELLLRTELASVSTRLAYLDDLKERLANAERRNDELREELVSGSREQESLRQSAENAERKVMRVENISRILREKLQAITGKRREPGDRAKGQEQLSSGEAEAEEQFWQRRLRESASVPRPGSLLYQELLGGPQDGVPSKEWPEAPLDGGPRGKKRRAQLENLPPDGGFGTVEAGDAAELKAADQSGTKGQLPSATGDTIFSFSRGEFDGRGEVLSKTLPAAPEQEKGVDRELSRDQAESGSDFVSAGNSNETSIQEAEDLSNVQEPDSNLPVPGQNTIVREGPSLDVNVETAKGESPTESNEGVVDESRSDGTDEFTLSGSDGNGQERVLQETVHSKPPDGTFQPGELCEDEGSGEEQTALDSFCEADGSKLPDKDVTGIYLGRSEEARAVMSESEAKGPSGIEARREETSKSSTSLNQNGNDSSLILEPKPPSQNEQDIGNTAQSEEKIAMNDSLLRGDKIAEKSSSSSTEGAGRIEETGTLVEEAYSSWPDLQQEGNEVDRNTPLASSSSDEETIGEEYDVRKPLQDRVPVPTADELMDAANKLVKEARKRGTSVLQSDALLRRAISKLEAAMSLTPNRAVVQAQFGSALLARAKLNLADSAAYTRLTRALEYLSGSLDAVPDDCGNIFNTGLCLCLLGSMSEPTQAQQYYTRACGLYDRLLEIDGTSRIGSFNCGLAYISLGRLAVGDEQTNTEETIRCFETASNRFKLALELKPGDNKAQTYLDDCNRELAQLRGDDHS